MLLAKEDRIFWEYAVEAEDEHQVQRTGEYTTRQKLTEEDVQRAVDVGRKLPQKCIRDANG